MEDAKKRFVWRIIVPVVAIIAVGLVAVGWMYGDSEYNDALDRASQLDKESAERQQAFKDEIDDLESEASP